MAHVHHGHAPHPRTNLTREASPTEADGLQYEYRVEVERRFRRLRGVIRETIDANDALGLRERTNAADDISPAEPFPFSHRSAKQAAFQSQLTQWLQQGVLEPADELAVADGDHWTGTYVRASYREGIRYANQRLRDAGVQTPAGSVEAAFNAPVHTDQLGQLYTRNFQNLRDITRAVDRKVSRVLTRGLAEGKGPRALAADLTEEVRTLQRTRARTLARTEVLHSHNQASIRQYRSAGVARVEVLAHIPCELCEPYAGNEYPIDGLPAGGPPWHPNCVCTTIPVV